MDIILGILLALVIIDLVLFFSLALFQRPRWLYRRLVGI